jgi:hypothetical protein
MAPPLEVVAVAQVLVQLEIGRRHHGTSSCYPESNRKSQKWRSPVPEGQRFEAQVLEYSSQAL